MLLGEVFKNINNEYKNIKFKNIKFNSKDCKLNDIFFAIKGNTANGNTYIKNAINNGAKIIVSNLKFEGLCKKKFYIFIAIILENCFHMYLADFTNLNQTIL